jgi:hypothetical protein
MNGGLYWYDTYGNQYSVRGITYVEDNYDSGTTPPYTPSNTNTRYGFRDPVNNYRCTGMPLAFTCMTSMSTNAFDYSDAGNYCYIGFENHSPWLKDATGYNGLSYGWFPYYFYRYATGVDNGGIHGTISASLQYASLMSLGTGYANSNLHNGWWFYNTIAMGQGSVGWWFNTMRVFGNEYSLALKGDICT